MRFINLLTMQALVIEVILILSGFLVFPSSERSYKPCAADRTFDNTRQNVLMIKAVRFLPLNPGIISS